MCIIKLSRQTIILNTYELNPDLHLKIYLGETNGKIYTFCFQCMSLFLNLYYLNFFYFIKSVVVSCPLVLLIDNHLSCTYSHPHALLILESCSVLCAVAEQPQSFTLPKVRSVQTVPSVQQCSRRYGARCK